MSCSYCKWTFYISLVDRATCDEIFIDLMAGTKKNVYDRQIDVWEDNQSKLIERRFHLFTLIGLFNNLTYAISFNFPKNDN